uniref:Uncharacterized protein n=1 Tax=Myoviridae sp. ctCo31 TaxID=2825053 RepID=A0A8S5UML9_9CAUD|nr:MAG TPA: hypothetical protein [Myoviridae sp. ctCo31]
MIAHLTSINQRKQQHESKHQFLHQLIYYKFLQIFHLKILYTKHPY